MKKSTIFWNSLYIIIMIIYGIISLEIFIILLCLNSFITFAMMFGELDEERIISYFSIFINPFILFIFITFGIVIFLKFIYKNTIFKFNKWLNK